MNGIYHADFSTPNGDYGSGTVYLENGQIRGGDSVVAYFGSYTRDSHFLKGNVHLLLHGDGYSIFGNAKDLSFNGEKRGDTIEVKVEVPGTGIQGKIKLRKINDL